MGLLDSILGTLGGGGTPGGQHGGDNPLLAALGGLLQQNGGLQGLLQQFNQHGLGDIFSSWIGLGENKAVSPDQLQRVLGSEQIKGLAGSLGIDAGQASQFLSQYLPKIIDKLTPGGAVEGATDPQQGLAALLETGLGKMGGESSQQV